MSGFSNFAVNGSPTSIVPFASVGGLASGIDTNSLINELMTIEAQPQLALRIQQSREQTLVSTLQSINSAVSAFQAAAQNLTTASGWLAATASSSSNIVAATASSTAPAGTLTFTVDNLASSSSLVSSGSVGSTSAVVASGNILLSHATALGFGQLSSDSGLAVGAHTLAVTQSSAGATLTGATPVGGATTITSGSNDTIAYAVDGVAHSAILAAGTYTAGQLAAAIGTASGGALRATVTNGGALAVSTTSEGSAHTLAITGGNALAGLGLSAGSATGSDGQVSLDGGAAVTVSDASAGATLSLPGTGGSVSAVLSGGLRAGSTALTNVSSGDGTLATVVSTINAAGAGISATAVQVSASSYRLQLSSSATGAASTISMNPAAFGTALGSLTTLTSGADALVTVGSGPGSYQVSSASNTLSGLMTGVTLSLVKADAQNPVTVTVSQDPNSVAGSVQKMVDAANSALSQIHQATAYDPASKSAGALLGDPIVEELQNQILRAVADTVPGSSLDPSSVGIQLTSTGTITFDQTKFTTALAANPSAVTSLFRQAATGVAQRLQTVGKNATDVVSGSLTLAITGGQAQVTDLGNQVTAWQPILDAKRQGLQAKFTQMEALLSTLKAQSSSLSSAFGTTSSTTHA
jgi:flagellar hook-associated protein 2